MTFKDYKDPKYEGYKSECDFCGGYAFQLYYKPEIKQVEVVCFCGAQITIHLEGFSQCPSCQNGRRKPTFLQLKEWERGGKLCEVCLKLIRGVAP